MSRLIYREINVEPRPLEVGVWLAEVGDDEQAEAFLYFADAMRNFDKGPTAYLMQLLGICQKMDAATLDFMIVFLEYAQAEKDERATP